MPNPQILVIVGPTATGKSDLAVQLAQKYNGEIISADSRQIYKGLDIGSGKITPEEMKGVPHHMIDITEPSKQFTVVDYVKQAEVAISDIISRNKLPIIAGGTGFYIEALVEGMIFPEVLPNEELRNELKEMGAPELLNILKELDPERASDIDPSNARRLIRAIEIAKAIGKVPDISNRPAKYDAIYIGLDVDRDELRNKIKDRLLKRLNIGMLKEGKRLHEEGLSYERMEELGLEYRYMAYLFQDKINLDDMKEKLVTEIWRYAKRQLTWFNRNKKIIWIKAPYLEHAEKICAERLG